MYIGGGKTLFPVWKRLIKPLKHGIFIVITKGSYCPSYEPSILAINT